MKVNLSLISARSPCWLLLWSFCTVEFLTLSLALPQTDGVQANEAPTNETVPRLGFLETSLNATGEYSNPYTEVEAVALFERPDGTAWRINLFWDGASDWRFRISPDQVGNWTWSVESNDSGLDGQSGQFRVVKSDLPGSIEPMQGHPLHFQKQNGKPFWFFGETGWSIMTDHVGEQLDRQAVMHYIDTRAKQGFNAIHCMLISEAGWGNSGGSPFVDMANQQINPDYWKEVDLRLAYLNKHGITGGLALAWGDKGNGEPFPWRVLPGLKARQRYAKYIGSRYSAYDVYFLVSGEWDLSIRHRKGLSPIKKIAEEEIRQEYTEIGNALKQSDPHGRMIGIHPAETHSVVREFASADWMSFGDYQQNYYRLHDEILKSRANNLPVVNSEYGYYERDSDANGAPDKENSLSLAMMRHATWDIVMGGGYLVTGFGSTYFGGNRNPGPFNVDDEKNKVWEEQIQHLPSLFSGLPWWKLEPADSRVTAPIARGSDRQIKTLKILKDKGPKMRRIQAPPECTYWALADPGSHYLAYVRGVTDEIRLDVTVKKAEGKNTEDQDAETKAFQVRQFDPRTGHFTHLDDHDGSKPIRYTPPSSEDWVLLVTPLIVLNP